MARGSRLILDRYEPVGTAGVGGFGTVQIAWDPRIQRRVAIKTIRLTELDAYRAYLPGARAVSMDSTADRWHGVQPWNEFLDDGPIDYGGYPMSEYGPDDEHDPDELDEYDRVTSLSHLPGLDEARTAAMLSDPRIVTVYDFEIRDRTAYLIMEYVEGITLTQLLADYGDLLTLDMVASLFDAMAGALSVAHKAGVLHLDMKPDNIIINAQGQVKVTDFGLATLADASGVGTTGGGTIGYMPLEQMRREHLDVRTDEWSLASVAYEMLTGDNPFRANNLEQAEAAIENAELILPSLCWNGLDEQIDDVVFYALDPDREERYASVSDFAEEMDKFLGNAARGKEQLSMIVSDALGLNDDDDGGLEEGGEVDKPRDSRRFGVLSWLFGPRNRSSSDELAEREVDREQPQRAREVRKPVAPSAPREPLANRVGNTASNVLGRAFAAVGGGFVTWLALANTPFVPTAFGTGTTFIAGVVVAIVAAVGAIVPSIGALIALALLGASIAMCGHLAIGLPFIAVVVAWWLLVGREGKASANVALSLPLLGAVGGSSAVPFFSGAALSFPAAFVTTVLAVVEALVLGSLGSGTLIGWDAFSNWDYLHTDITGNFVKLTLQMSTWTTIAGWLAATTVLSLARSSGKRWLTFVGLAVALALVLTGSLVFSEPNPQLFVSSIAACAVLIAVFA